LTDLSTKNILISIFLQNEDDFDFETELTPLFTHFHI